MAGQSARKQLEYYRNMIAAGKNLNSDNGCKLEEKDVLDEGSTPSISTISVTK